MSCKSTCVICTSTSTGVCSSVLLLELDSLLLFVIIQPYCAGISVRRFFERVLVDTLSSLILRFSVQRAKVRRSSSEIFPVAGSSFNSRLPGGMFRCLVALSPRTTVARSAALLLISLCISSL